MDLKRLDTKIQKLIKNRSLRDNLKSTLTHNLQKTNNSQNQTLNQTQINIKNKVTISPKKSLTNTIDNITYDNDFPQINPLNIYTNSITKNENNNKNKEHNSNSVIMKKHTYFKSPLEELAELEKELARKNQELKILMIS